MKTYSHSDYNALVKKTVDQIYELSNLKGGEYAGDTDRLANFRRNADSLGLQNEQVWAVYAAKHYDAIMQYIRDLGEGKTRPRLESIAGRADDLIVYLVLFKALLEDRENGSVGIVGDSSPVPEHQCQTFGFRSDGPVVSFSSVCNS